MYIFLNTSSIFYKKIEQKMLNSNTIPVTNKRGMCKHIYLSNIYIYQIAKKIHRKKIASTQLVIGTYGASKCHVFSRRQY